MKLGLFTLLLSIPSYFLAQDNKEANVSNAFSSGSAKVTKFDNKARKFNDWAISFGGGTAFLHHSDLTSFNNDGKNFGWNAYVELEKQVSDKFAFILQFQKGETKQTARLPYLPIHGLGVATTEYNQLSLLGDMNFSNLFRRVDNKSPFRWAIHGYAGIGLQGYTYHRTDDHPNQEANRDFTQPFRIDSFFYQGGVGLKYNLSRRIDLETRVMYIITGDDEFDGGGETSIEWPYYNEIKKNNSDNMIVANVGFSIKLGKHNTHLGWYDASNDALYKIAALDSKPVDALICKNGDKDEDGVCDDWDRELNTPRGARVDGSGKALDMDLDGVIDLDDKCVTTPGLVKNHGCPYINEDTMEIIEEINKFEGIEFELNKDVIRPQSFAKLDRAAEIIKKLDSSIQFYVIGGTDTRASDAYNFDLSERRAKAVKQYLIDKGVNADMLITEGRGEKDLKYPECNPASKCPEWKNEANRRVYFKSK